MSVLVPRYGARPACLCHHDQLLFFSGYCITVLFCVLMDLIRVPVHASAQTQLQANVPFTPLCGSSFSPASHGLPRCLPVHACLWLVCSRPNVVIDNETYDECTVITIDSANRPGTLIEVGGMGQASACGCGGRRCERVHVDDRFSVSHEVWIRATLKPGVHALHTGCPVPHRAGPQYPQGTHLIRRWLVC